MRLAVKIESDTIVTNIVVENDRDVVVFEIKNVKDDDGHVFENGEDVVENA